MKWPDGQASHPADSKFRQVKLSPLADRRSVEGRGGNDATARQPKGVRPVVIAGPKAISLAAAFRPVVVDAPFSQKYPVSIGQLFHKHQ